MKTILCVAGLAGPGAGLSPAAGCATAAKGKSNYCRTKKAPAKPGLSEIIWRFFN